MKIKTEKMEVLGSGRFLYLSMKEALRKSFPIAILPRALEWKGEIYPAEMLNSIKTEGETEFQVISVLDEKELVTVVFNLFRIQGGEGESDIVTLIDALSTFGVSTDAIVGECKSYFGKSFGKQEEFYRWAMNLSKEVKELLREKSLNLRALFLMRGEGDDVFNIFLSIVKNLKINSNSFRNIANWSKEISVRDSITIKELMDRIAFEDILELEIPAHEKSALFLERLYEARYPTWRNKKVLMKSESDSFKSKTGVDIILPEFVEGNSVLMKFGVSSIGDLDGTLEKISSNRENVEKILKEVQE